MRLRASGQLEVWGAAGGWGTEARGDKGHRVAGQSIFAAGTCPAVVSSQRCWEQRGGWSDLLVEEVLAVGVPELLGRPGQRDQSAVKLQLRVFPEHLRW